MDQSRRQRIWKDLIMARVGLVESGRDVAIETLRRMRRPAVCALLAILVSVSAVLPMPASAVERQRSPQLEYAMNVFDWTIGWTDYELFRRMVDQLPALGFTTVELGVPWDSVEKAPRSYDFSEVDKRVAYVEEKGLRLRLRVNVQDYPGWFSPELMARPDGTTNLRSYGHRTGVPSFFDGKTTGVQARWVNAVARHYAGRSYEYTLGIGVHFELKYGGWNSYERPAVVGFRNWLAKRYTDIASLNRAWGTDYATFGAVDPPVPAPTPSPVDSTTPDTSESNADWVRFREESLAGLVARYYRGIRANDTTAMISSPLGETFRAQSAEFGNQDIAGLSRHADTVVFSYDFFIGGGFESLWNVKTMVKTYRDITEVPVKLEIDGPGTYDAYGEDYIFQAGVAALDAGAAGLNVANYTYERDWVENLAQFQALGRLGDHIAQRNNGPTLAEPSPEILLYVSKWTQYAFRSPVEWLHRYQFGMLSLLLEQGVAVRVVTDENLMDTPPAELCRRYSVAVLPYDVVVDERIRSRLGRLLQCIPAMQDMRLAETAPAESGISQTFGVRAVASAEPLEAGVESTEVLRSFAIGAPIRVQGLGQPTASQFVYEPLGAAVQPQARSNAGGLVWAYEDDVRRVTLGYNAGEVYAQGGYKNTTCAVVVDTLRWLGASIPTCRSVPDITPPVYDFGRAAASAQTGIEVRTAGLSAGAAFGVDEGALTMTPPTGGAEGGRTVATYAVTVPADRPTFSAHAQLVEPDSGPVVVSVLAERSDGTPLPLAEETVRSGAPVEMTASLAEAMGEQVDLRISVSSASRDGAANGVVRLGSAKVLGGDGVVALDLAEAAPSATMATELASQGLSSGAQFFNLSTSSLKVHPPWSGSTGATYAAYNVQLPDHPARFEATLAKEMTGGDGTWFSATVVDANNAAHLLAIRRVVATDPVPVTADMTEFAGQTVEVILRVDAGPAGDPSYDATRLFDPRIVAND
jgi:hypothetical protein